MLTDDVQGSFDSMNTKELIFSTEKKAYRVITIFNIYLNLTMVHMSCAR